MSVAVHVNLTSVLANTGRTAGAVCEFRRSVALEPDPEAKRALEQVRPARGRRGGHPAGRLG